MGKTWKELGFGRKKGKKNKNRSRKNGKGKVKFVPFTPSTPQPTYATSTNARRKGTVVELENLGMVVEWVNGKVYVHRNGHTEVYNNFSELKVPSRKVKRGTKVTQTRPNARYFERNGARYYVFKNIGVAVRSCISYWPEESDAQPPEHLFGRAGEEEVRELLRVDEEKFRKRARKAVERVLRIVAKQNGYELPPPNLPVSQALIEELRESGFEVRVKAGGE